MSRPNTPERIALEELVKATEAHLAGSHSDEAWHIARARVVLALNAARNALQLGRVLDGIAADPSIGHGHVGSVG